ncbi:unnamed protein product [Oncorhynchus mykiss]|uniref:F5/8 type C domain-containing protein n=1 Tax=Oncorhynchus mykiss TaxID=8022 RepID=A0A060ZS16_ONCMY|nr:unnamed protein product [Oncorhynchus mykiss]
MCLLWLCFDLSVCLRGLGVEDGNVTDSMLSASSSQSSHGPNGARLNGGSCWMPSNPLNSWIQVNLGEAKKITGVVIQGCPGADHWVTKFKIQHSMDGSKWTDYKDDGGVFTGCMDRNTPETQLLGTPVSAQYVRILPQEFNGQTGLRFDILGCIPDYAVSCDAKPNFNFANDLMTVHCPAGCAQVLYTVYGSGVYRGDSNICAAGIHAGVILNDIGGDCTMLKEPGQNFYSGSTKNGITSRQYDGNYQISYQFADKGMLDYTNAQTSIKLPKDTNMGFRVAQRSKTLHLSARGVTTDPGSIPGCITTGCDRESHRAAHNWPSVVRVWPSL